MSFLAERYSSKSALVFRHRSYQGLGTFEKLLICRGFDVNYVDVEKDDLGTCDPVGADLVVFLGGPFSINDEALSFISKEIAFAERRITCGRPVLGICLGAQILAKALGAEVRPGKLSEIGWKKVVLTDTGLSGPLSHLEQIPVLHWHRDMFSIPIGCLHLASTSMCANQAFSFSKHVLALQFHVEVDPNGGIDSWIVDHANELRGEGCDPSMLRRQTFEAAALPRSGVEKMFDEWLLSANSDFMANY